MRTFLYGAFLIMLSHTLYAQRDWNQLLQGTWKVASEDMYEHWDALNAYTLKGFSYRLKDNRQNISEYLTITKRNTAWVYEATVIGQNNGNTVAFSMQPDDTALVIVNLKHDFPKKIVYKYRNDSLLHVTVSDNASKAFSYNLHKQLTGAAAAVNTGSSYDAALAHKLGADDYGMKKYFFVILKTGSNTTTDEKLKTESFRQHLDNIGRLVKEQKLVVAGPVSKNEKTYRGIFIFHNVSSARDLEALLQSDAAIKHKYLDYEIYDWYGSAALPVYLETVEKITKEKP